MNASPDVSSNDKRTAALAAAGATLATGGAIAYAFDPRRAGSPMMLVAMAVAYVTVAVFALRRLAARGELREVMRPLRGDIWAGGMLAGLLYGGGMLGHLILIPRGSPREAWLMRLYVQLGDPNGEGREIVGLFVFFIAVLEEIVWRGLVFRALEPVIGKGRALLLSSFLFALAHVPTLFFLGDPVAGPNPLIVLAAFGCSMVWGATVMRTKRLPPALLAHGLFSWAMVEFPIWRP